MKKLLFTYLLVFFSIINVSLLSAQNMVKQSNEEELLQKYCDFFTSDSLLGRKAGSEGELKTARYVYDQLKTMNLIMMCGRDGQKFIIANKQDSIYSRNILAISEGYDDSLRNEYLVIGANMDHFGYNNLNVDGKLFKQIFQGANNNASGMACLLELARRISLNNFRFKRSVIFAAFGAKEKGMVGSWYFVNKGFSHINDVVLMADLNMVGRKSRDRSLRYYEGDPCLEIKQIITKLSPNTYITPDKGTNIANISDYLAFKEQKIPTVLFTTGGFSTYNARLDVKRNLDYSYMDDVCDYLYNFIMAAANYSGDIELYKPELTVEKHTQEEKKYYSAYEIDQSPTFFKGNELKFLQDWIYKYLKYPESAVDEGIQGIVYVEFIIDEKGNVTNVTTSENLDVLLESEVKKVVKASPRWKPGKLEGEPVKVKYKLPIEFKLKRRK
ncbi:MAG: TonB family protein [Bacteroidales bacterium]